MIKKVFISELMLFLRLDEENPTPGEGSRPVPHDPSEDTMDVIFLDDALKSNM